MADLRFSAAAATLVKVYYMRDLTKLSDVTYSWGPISIWYMCVTPAFVLKDASEIPRSDVVYRAEIFVLIIAGTLPTLKPIWSTIRGRMPSSSSYAVGPNKNHYFESSSGADGASHPSKDSKGFVPRRPGNVTIALNEIDNITQREAGSSSESILPRQQHVQEVQTASEARAEPTEERLVTPQLPSIRVERKFSVTYDQRVGTEPDAEKHCRFS